jgi:hypothetical protein
LFFSKDKAHLKREPTELIVIETPSAVLAADKALDIADYSGEYEGEEDSFDYVDYTISIVLFFIVGQSSLETRAN